MRTLAQRYEQDFLKLLALYSLTTSVKTKAVVSVAGVHHRDMTAARECVQADLRTALELDVEPPIEDDTCLERIRRGEHLDCVTRVAVRVMDNQRLLLALYIVTTSATRKAVTDLFGIGRTCFRKEMSQIKAMLAAEVQRAS
jgi:hypothetical protein